MEFIVKTTIKANPQQIYDAWMSNEGHSAMTGGEADIDNQVESEFTAWDGYIWGKNIELVPNERIVQSWRTSEFEETDRDSRIEVQLTPVKDGTEITLIHTDLAENGAHYKQGWVDHYFNPMKVYFEG